MVKTTKSVASTSALKDAKLEIKNLKAQLKELKVAHKKELSNAVVATYESAVQAAYEEFEAREIAREAVIEKAVNQALVAFEKSLDKKVKKSTKKTKATKKKAASKKKA